MKKRLVLAGSALVASLGLGLSAVPAVAAQNDVTIDCNENGSQNLINAIKDANNNGGGTIRLAKRCAYRFETSFDGLNALPPITRDVKIIGDKSTLIRSVRGDEFRILRVEEGGSLTLKGVTVTGGLLTSDPNDAEGNADGGGIANEGSLWLEKSTVIGNQITGDGGGISNEGGYVTLVNSRVLTNIAFDQDKDAADGGGISNNADGTLTIKKSTIAGNTSEEDGGGIQNQGTLTAEGTLFSKNEARDDDGAAINNLGSAKIKDSKFVENYAGLEGGAINNDPSNNNTLEVTGSSFHRNVAGRDGGALNNEGIATLKTSTIKGNQAGRDGGGINNEEEDAADPTVLTLEYTKVTENRAARHGGGINNWVGAEVILKHSKIFKNRPDNCAGAVPGC
ncbi:hypothetical protein [Streptomyces sp. MZ04]|uniref:hypothetical protein n=1 Tax=Streptomyces sp. MZ04 TaxID=2559236 RepID=UPI00107EDF19|nr:hypothetical protein [Streptomyces sp. MZ04]TGA93676.1 hypothetical protein E2651_35800 [Streptomyces sp. MZ04]